MTTLDLPRVEVPSAGMTTTARTIFEIPLDRAPREGMARIMLDGTAVLLAHVDGEYFALDDMCSHEDAWLTQGRLDGDKVKCPLHGSRFCLRTGEPLEEPADEPVRCYPVTVHPDRLVIDLAGPTTA